MPDKFRIGGLKLEPQSYWQQQTNNKPLFPDIAWSKPEQKAMAGRLAIIGGNSSIFRAVAESYDTALKTGVGEVKILLPETLKNSLPKTILDVSFTKANQSGGLSNQAIDDLIAIAKWGQAVLLIGDSGQSSETAILYEKFISQYDGPLTITRDTIDLLKSYSQDLVSRPQTLIVASFAQLQKIFQAVYYPKILTFSIQLSSLIEAVYKFTITYPVCLVVFFNNKLIVAYQGQVTTTDWTDSMAIWRGQTATKATVYWLWSQNQILEAVTTSLL